MCYLFFYLSDFLSTLYKQTRKLGDKSLLVNYPLKEDCEFEGYDMGWPNNVS